MSQLASLLVTLEATYLAQVVFYMIPWING